MREEQQLLLPTHPENMKRNTLLDLFKPRPIPKGKSLTSLAKQARKLAEETRFKQSYKHT